MRAYEFISILHKQMNQFSKPQSAALLYITARPLSAKTVLLQYNE